VGFTPLNWTSQRIPEYIEDLTKAIQNLVVVVDAVQTNAATIENITRKISETLLVQGRDVQLLSEHFQPRDIVEFFDVLESKQNSRLEGLVNEYNQIPTFLMSVEERVCKTKTGSSPVLTAYYYFWEKHVYNAIAEMIIGSIAALLGMLECKDTGPLFRVQVALSGKDFVTTPTTSEIQKLFETTKGTNTIISSARLFHRWKNGTCKFCEPELKGEDEVLQYSYWDDIKYNNVIVNLTYRLQNWTKSVRDSTDKYIDGWKSYDKTVGVQGFWDSTRKLEVDKTRTDALTMSYLVRTIYFHSYIKGFD
jgi:hypothetical protein